MELLRLFITSSIPVLKVLLVIAVGLFLATERVDLLGPDARHHLNNLIFYASFLLSLAAVLLIQSLLRIWLPSNLGNMFLIILPALCKEKDSPFGQSSSCSGYAKAYVSLSLGLQAIYVWSVPYFTMGTSAKHAVKEINTDDDSKVILEMSPTSRDCSKDGLYQIDMPQTEDKGKEEIVGLIIGISSPIRNTLIGDTAPLRFIYSSAELIGEAGIPSLTLIVGANLLKGLKGSGVSPSLVIGVLVIRTILVPGSGILIVKAAKHWGMVNSNPFYQFTLLLQYAILPAMKIAAISQMLGTGESEFSVLMLWSYLVAPFSLALWTAFYLWLVS